MGSWSSEDNEWMQLALEQAKLAYQHDEVPIGAVLIDDRSQLLAKAYNQTITMNDPTAHAEILVVRESARQLGNHRLLNTTLYVTLEPCAMCAGAMIQARVKRLVYAAKDPKGGAVTSLFNVLDNTGLNHNVENCSGLCEGKSVTLLKQFFREKR